MGELSRKVQDILPGQKEVYVEISGVGTALSAGTFIVLKQVLSTPTKINAVSMKLTISGGTPVNPVARITSRPANTGSYEKIFPFGASFDVTSGKEVVLERKLTIPRGRDYQIEMKVDVTGGASATLDFLRLVEVG